MAARRAQTPIAFRSDRAAARLALLTRGGRSQAEVMEEALDLMPVPDLPSAESDAEELQYARLKRLIQEGEPGSGSTMKELDALEYDEFGDLR